MAWLLLAHVIIGWLNVGFATAIVWPFLKKGVFRSLLMANTLIWLIALAYQAYNLPIDYIRWKKIAHDDTHPSTMAQLHNKEIGFLYTDNKAWRSGVQREQLMEILLESENIDRVNIIAQPAEDADPSDKPGYYSLWYTNDMAVCNEIPVAASIYAISQQTRSKQSSPEEKITFPVRMKPRVPLWQPNAEQECIIIEESEPFSRGLFLTHSSKKYERAQFEIQKNSPHNVWTYHLIEISSGETLASASGTIIEIVPLTWFLPSHLYLGEHFLLDFINKNITR